MTLEIYDPAVLAKVEELAQAMGLAEEVVVARAIERLGRDVHTSSDLRAMSSILHQLGEIPDRTDAFDPLLWDDEGLPRPSLAPPRVGLHKAPCFLPT